MLTFAAGFDDDKPINSSQLVELSKRVQFLYLTIPPFLAMLLKNVNTEEVNTFCCQFVLHQSNLIFFEDSFYSNLNLYIPTATPNASSDING